MGAEVKIIKVAGEGGAGEPLTFPQSRMGLVALLLAMGAIQSYKEQSPTMTQVPTLFQEAAATEGDTS